MEEQVSNSQNQVTRVPIGRLGRQAEPGSRSTAHSVRIGVPWWAVVAAGAAPTLLVVGFLVAAMLQPVSYDSLRDTISTLAARGAADPWVMTVAIAAVGACYLVTALGLSPARGIGRLALAGGGVATLSIAALPTPLHGYSRPHALAVIAASTTMCAWPILAADRQRHGTRVEVWPECRRIRGHRRSHHVVLVRDQRRRTRDRRALCSGCSCALAVPRRLRSSPSPCPRWSSRA